MLRGIQPTIRLAVSNFVGRQGTVLGWRERRALALRPAVAPTLRGAFWDYQVASCSAPLPVSASSEALKPAPIASRKALEAGRRRKTAGFVDTPRVRARSRHVNPSTGVTKRCDRWSLGRIQCTAFCQQLVQPLFFQLARGRQRRLNDFVRSCALSRRCGKNTYIEGWSGSPANPIKSRPEAATGDGRP
jgi:hypothetical protein